MRTKPLLAAAALVLGLVTGFATVWLILNRDDGTIRDDRAFERELSELQRDAIPVLLEVDLAGGEPTEDQRERLETFHPRLERLLRYNEGSIVATFLAGKLNSTLRNDPTARKWLLQCIENAEPKKDTLDIGLTRLEAFRLLSEVELRMGDYEAALEAAEVAVEGKPTAPDYLVTRASVLVQLNRIPEAKRDLRRALQLDSTHRRAQGLLDFIDRGA